MTKITEQIRSIYLTNVHVHIDVGSDGVDQDSTVYYRLYGPRVSNIADHTLRGGASSYHPQDFDLELLESDIQLSEINTTTFYMAITAYGHDHFEGTLKVQFTFSNGAKYNFDYGYFGIGTYHESHDTRKMVMIQEARQFQGSSRF